MAVGMMACGSKDASSKDGNATGTETGSSAEMEDGVLNYADITLGEDYTDLTATITFFNHRTDMDSEDYGGKNWKDYIAAFNEMYPNITVKVSTDTNYADDALTHLQSGDYETVVMLPAVAMQVTVYKVMTTLSFVNHLYGYIIMMCGTDVISIYIFIQFMENIPVSLDESAIIDGASYWTIYWKIMLPLLKPAIVTSCILKGVGVYNEYYCANLYLQDKNLHTIATSLYTFVGPMESQYNLICAGVIISLLPALLVFILCQKQIYSGIAAGAAKG